MIFCLLYITIFGIVHLNLEAIAGIFLLDVRYMGCQEWYYLLPILGFYIFTAALLLLMRLQNLNYSV
jgi:Mg2+ and Co2+ transporter CorA